ncbi:hypothetical protein GWI33_017861 [Rhynchophorus ferrugineus]|uniref:Uncharacterized protein n=1 Tax=Rhynchophorus ferrugineus TaxID=354439 RepID=A0A834I8F8_RHYFE|nr:hypothetical protein GWI33_017861 [Rhynchophorus ferrugineus]
MGAAGQAEKGVVALAPSVFNGMCSGPRYLPSTAAEGRYVPTPKKPGPGIKARDRVVQMYHSPGREGIPRALSRRGPDARACRPPDHQSSPTYPPRQGPSGPWRNTRNTPIIKTYQRLTYLHIITHKPLLFLVPQQHTCT